MLVLNCTSLTKNNGQSIRSRQWRSSTKSQLFFLSLPLPLLLGELSSVTCEVSAGNTVNPNHCVRFMLKISLEVHGSAVHTGQQQYVSLVSISFRGSVSISQAHSVDEKVLAGWGDARRVSGFGLQYQEPVRYSGNLFFELRQQVTEPRDGTSTSVLLVLLRSRTDLRQSSFSFRPNLGIKLEVTGSEPC